MAWPGIVIFIYVDKKGLAIYCAWFCFFVLPPYTGEKNSSARYPLRHRLSGMKVQCYIAEFQNIPGFLLK